jgi:hypothetical protein
MAFPKICDNFSLWDAAMKNLLWLFLLAIGQSLSGQDCRVAAVNVLSSDTHQPVPFQPQRLHASLGKVPLEISNFVKIRSNRILILVDISGSMEIPGLRKLLDLVLQQVPRESSLAFGFFNDKVILSDGFSDAEQFGKALRQLPTLGVNGHTALYDALDQGLKLFHTPNPGDSILLISDGDENGSRAGAKTIKREVLESGLRLFMIMPTYVIESPPHGPEAGPSANTVAEEIHDNQEAFRLLSDLAEKSGGAIYTLTLNKAPWSIEKWRAPVLESIQKFWIEAVGGGYLMTVNLPPEQANSSALTVRLDRSGDKSLEYTFVTYPRRLASCTTAIAAH